MGDEQKWIRDIQRRGSRSAADALVRTYYKEIFAFVWRQTGQREDALDLTQNIFIAALRSLPGYDPRRASFRTWLYRIAANKVIDCRRRFRPEVLPLQDTEIPDTSDFTAQIQDRALLEQIEAYVSALDTQLQAIFRLRVYGEKSFPEIAAAVGRSEAAVKAQYYRLIGRLRKEFDYGG